MKAAGGVCGGRGVGRVACDATLYEQPQDGPQQVARREGEREERRGEKAPPPHTPPLSRCPSPRTCYPPALMTVKLAMSIEIAGEAGSAQRTQLEQDLIADLAAAAGVPPACFCITKVSPGSIIAEVQVSGGGSADGGGGSGADPREVVRALEAQAGDAESRLRGGKLTRSLLHLAEVEAEESDEGGGPGRVPAFFLRRDVAEQALEGREGEARRGGSSMAEADVSVVEELTRERDAAKAELAEYVLEEVARRKKEEEQLRAGGSAAAYTYGGLRHHGNLEMLVANMNALKRALSAKTASEHSLEETVRRLRESETKLRVQAAERERTHEEARVRERGAWRAQVRVLVGELGELALAAAQVRIGVGQGEEARRRLALELGRDVDDCTAAAVAARSPLRDVTACEELVPQVRRKMQAGGMVVQVWQENALTPEQQVEVLEQQLAARERDAVSMQRKLETKATLQEEATREYEALRKEYLAVQLELKVAHETAWEGEEELQALRGKLAAREREVVAMMDKIARKEGAIQQLHHRAEHERQHTDLEIARLKQDVAVGRAHLNDGAGMAVSGGSRGGLPLERASEVEVLARLGSQW